jgi:protoheme IX farnesyltransferase
MVFLARPTLSLFVSFTSLATCIHFRHTVDRGVFFLTWGIFLLSCAASALNQLQERGVDARMERTKARPLAAGRLSARFGTLFSVFLGAIGLWLLYWGANPASALWGAVAVIMYNGVYTPLKTRSASALFPGAVAGALPVLIGCAAGLGRIEAKAVFIAAFVFLWQMPHFLLLLLRHEADYRRSGIVTLLSRISPRRLGLIIGIWTLGAGGATMLFPLLGIVRNLAPAAIIGGLNVFLVVTVVRSLRGIGTLPPVRGLYLYQGGVFAALVIQGLA